MEAPVTLPQAGAPCTQAVLGLPVPPPPKLPPPGSAAWHRVHLLPAHPYSRPLEAPIGGYWIVHFLVFGDREDAASRVKEQSLGLASRVPGSHSPLARLSWCCALWLGDPALCTHAGWCPPARSPSV